MRIPQHLVWKDALGDLFCLIDYGEIYPSPPDLCKTHFRLSTWSSKFASLVKSKSLIEHELSTDDPLWLLDFPKADLPKILALGTKRKRRRDLNGNWIKKAEQKLAHKIIATDRIFEL